MNARVIFDKVSTGMGAMERLKLMRELNDASKNVSSLGGGAMAAMQRLKLMQKVNGIRAKLGVKTPEIPKIESVIAENTQKSVENTPNPVVSDDSEFGLQARGKKTREKINAQVVAIVDAIKSGKDAKTLTPEEIALLKQYSGKGGLTDNSQYEYYTPPPIAEGSWDILKANGFRNGNVLEPSTGAGVFSATKPQGAVITGTEIDPIAATVNAALHPDDSILNQSFEKLAVSAPDNFFDAVIGNVPFGDARGPSAMDDPAYKSEKRIERYFINRVIDKTRAGGLITLVVPTGVIANMSGPWKKFRAEISRKAEFLGAHKLPSKTFGAQGTDVVTDIIVLRKHPTDLAAKVDALPSATLQSANVLWDEFISGKYWLGEGKRFIHGQYIPADKSKFRSMEQVIPENGATPESLKLKLAMHFDSRIDWELLDSAEPVIVYYAAGDRRSINGKEMEFDGQHWSEVQYQAPEGALDAVKYGATSTEALQLIVASPESMLNLSSDQAFRIFKDFPNLLNTQQKMAIEFSQSQPLDVFREQAYRGSLIGSLVTQYLAKSNNGDDDEGERAHVRGIIQNEFEKYGHPRNAKGFYLEGEAARYFGSYLNAFDEKGKISSAIEEGIEQAQGYDAENPLSVIEYMVKAKSDGMLTLEAFKAAYTGSRAINSLADLADVSGIAFTPEGMITTSSKYCCGEIYVKAGQLMAVMESETDSRLKEKFQSQIDEMFAKAKRTGIEDITFGLRDKWIKASYKNEFLLQQGFTFKYLVDGEKISDTGETFEGKINDVSSSEQNGEWVLNFSRGGDFARQLEHYMNGKSIGYNVKEKGGEEKEDRIARYREQVTSLEELFTIFMQSHADFADIERTYNTTFNNYVAPEYDRGDLGLQGVSAQVKPHWYQNQVVRKLSAEGAGILGHDVGLGKTFEAIAFSVYDRQMLRSNKHLIVVPKAVLGNWYMESKQFLGNHDDVMFVGFEPKRDKDGKIKTEPKLDENGNQKYNKHTGEAEFQDLLEEDSREEVFEKMHKIPQSKIGLTVMTYEKYATIPMREENRMKYAEKWVEKHMMTNADKEKIGTSYNDAKKKDKIKGNFSNDGTKKKQELPYFEDMGFDRVIIDEAHSFKNSFAMDADVGNLAYISNPAVSQRAQDMAMKMSYLREKYDGKGPILLTATPVANSPIEIFNMLSLVIDPSEFDRLGIYTPGDFVRVFGDIKMVDKSNVSGEVKQKEGLAGFKNLNALRALFHRYADMKNAQDVDPNGDVLKLPEAVEMISKTTMSAEQSALYVSLRAEAKESAKRNKGAARPMFAVIRDMDRVTTDVDLFHHTITFLFKTEDQKKVDALIAALPASLKVKITDEETQEKVTIDVDKETGYSVSGDTLTYSAPEDYEDAIASLFDKFKINYVSHPLTPKYAKLIENIRAELDSNGKQIIFTEEKSQHGKLKRIIVNNLPVTESMIGIINAATADGEKLQQISDAFNRGDFRIIIANKKAEVGVNLQKGTSAIHHMTLPWNPASMQQRNGRGLRQGNTAPQVRIYCYQAVGSFDEYRLDLLKNKGNWIASLMDKNNDADKSENAEAMGALEQAALLSDNREEFLAMIAKQKESKLAEEKEKRDNTAKTKLNQLSLLTIKLDAFEDDKAKAKTDAADLIAKAEKSLQKAIDEKAEADVIERRKTQLMGAKVRLGKIDGEWDKKKADAESQRKQAISYLSGLAATGKLKWTIVAPNNQTVN